MSRSIHETRSMLRKTRRENWSHDDEKSVFCDHLQAQLDLKRGIKNKITQERQGRNEIQESQEIITTTNPAGIPIVIEDEGPCIHYPATPDDLRAIMRRLPQGVCDGLTSIALCLDARRPVSEREQWRDCQPDPFTGRPSLEIMPGVWSRANLGEYLPQPARIRLHACAYSPDLEGRPLKEFLLKLRSLSTFGHHIAYHFDDTRRQARGRWIMVEAQACENFAGNLENDWLHGVVVPYLVETYPDQTRRLIDWVEYHGGCRLTLDQMAGDPRKCIYNIQQILFGLVEWVEEEVDETDTRPKFADFLHMFGFYEEALTIIETLLGEYGADDPWLLRLKAHIFCDQGLILIHDGNQADGRALLERSREISLAVIAKEPEYADAWGELWYACEGLELWDEVIAAATRHFELEESDLKLYGSLLLSRIRARIAKGDFSGAEADLKLLEQSPWETVRDKVESYRLKLTQARAGSQVP